MVVIGYARVSTSSQGNNCSLDQQSNQLMAFGIAAENIYREIGSATTIDGRPILKSILRDKIAQGDLLVVVSLDRFSRKILDTLFELDKLHKKGAFFRSLSGPHENDWTAKETVFSMALYSFLAQSELENRELRTKAGIQRAKLEKKYKGRATKITPPLLKELENLLTKGVKSRHICAILQISRSTYYLAKQRLKELKDVP